MILIIGGNFFIAKIIINYDILTNLKHIFYQILYDKNLMYFYIQSIHV